MVIPRCEKSKDVIEPILKPQWWMKMDDMAKAAMEASPVNESAGPFRVAMLLRVICTRPPGSSWGLTRRPRLSRGGAGVAAMSCEARRRGGVLAQLWLTVVGMLGPRSIVSGSETPRCPGSRRDRPCRTPVRGLPQRAPMARVRGRPPRGSRAGGYVRRLPRPLRRRAARTIGPRASRRSPTPRRGANHDVRSAPTRARGSSEEGAARAASRRVHHRENRQGRRPKSGEDASTPAATIRRRRDPAGR